MAEGWYCAICKTHHAPNLSTCPVNFPGSVARETVGIREWTSIFVPHRCLGQYTES